MIVGQVSKLEDKNVDENCVSSSLLAFESNQMAKFYWWILVITELVVLSKVVPSKKKQIQMILWPFTSTKQLL